MKKSFFDKNNLIILIVLTLVALFYFVAFNDMYYSFLNGAQDSIGNQSLLMFLFNLYSGNDFVVFVFAIGLLLTVVSGYQYHRFQNKKEDLFEIQRIGYKKYYKNMVFSAIRHSFWIPIVINIISILFLIHIGYKWHGNPGFTRFGLSQNLDFILYLVFQAIGWSLINVFITIISQYISNRYVYLSFLLVFSFLITVLSVFIGSIVPNIDIPSIGKLQPFLLMITSPYTLLTAGSFAISSGFDNLLVVVVLANMLYLIVSLLLFNKLIKIRKKKLYAQI